MPGSLQLATDKLQMVSLDFLSMALHPCRSLKGVQTRGHQQTSCRLEFRNRSSLPHIRVSQKELRSTLTTFQLFLFEASHPVVWGTDSLLWVKLY